MTDGTITYHWTCTTEGVVSYDFGNISFSGSDGSVQFEILSSEGAWLLPAAEMEEGASWTHNYSVRMVSSGEGAIPITSSAAQNFTSAGVEPTVTEAGSFEALRVDGTAVYSTSMAEIPIPDTNSTFTYWLVYGVGLVRGDSTTGDFSSSSVLVSYSIP
jgi:hypothetical protein